MFEKNITFKSSETMALQQNRILTLYIIKGILCEMRLIIR
ncbi:hypothetical protein E2C01_083128 [Portunus trituberculatus]|uniref:Uncharacterized protein n=1 Tax=Portunus trituberculatus TaxID=210409 RepID=A0A5B7J0X6_PORTR|nr:hypothetical protein [Portunus trituberculatus]